MAQSNRSQKESEEYAKNWQIDNVSQQVEDNEQSRKSDSEEIKSLIKDVDKKIDSLPNKFVTKEELKLEIQAIHTQYGPMKKGFWWLSSALGLLIIAYFFQLFINLSKVVGQ